MKFLVSRPDSEGFMDNAQPVPEAVAKVIQCDGCEPTTDWEVEVRDLEHLLQLSEGWHDKYEAATIVGRIAGQPLILLWHR